MSVALVTDSTAYLPADLVQQYGITVAPQLLIWGDQTLRDGIDIQPDEFYARLKTARTLPTTSQAAVVTFQDIFGDLIARGSDVLGVFISSRLSGTIQSASQAREALGPAAERVVIVDSYSTSMAMGFPILAAARASQQGAKLAECGALVEEALRHAGVYFALDTLEFVHRGGRIGGAQRFLGSALNLKPILTLQDGRVEPIDRVRTKGKALERVLELVAEKVKGQSNIRLAALHANVEQEARDLLERAASQLGAVETVFSAVSPVVGTHAGPGTVGLAYMAGV